MHAVRKGPQPPSAVGVAAVAVAGANSIPASGVELPRAAAAVAVVAAAFTRLLPAAAVPLPGLGHVPCPEAAVLAATSACRKPTTGREGAASGIAIGAAALSLSALAGLVAGAGKAAGRAGRAAMRASAVSAYGGAPEGLLGEARRWLSGASKVVVLTGAGISTDSGVPDFRGPAGVWTKDPSKQRLVDLDAWLSDSSVREEGWRWLASWRLSELRPNSGHEAVTELQRQGKLLLCVTQNTEGLQEMAGLSPELLVTIHGSRWHVNCMGRSQERWLDFSHKPEAPQVPAPATGVCKECDFWCYSAELLQRVESGEADPRCPACGYILKTANISFGQSLVQADIQLAMEAARECDLLLAVGSTLAVFPVANMVPAAKMAGARVVIVNGEPTAMDDLADIVLRGQIGDILPELVRTTSSL
mmetsp:Transcript_79096/g.256092  ORF Transcript_79096/g.256092 Transcript_79096/m.256092 type:complete len:418 (+) Transcript_79096:55-1308(+)